MLWLDEQARLLREGRLERLDIPNLLEEIEDMGRSNRRAIKNNLVVVLLHLLKHHFQPRQRTRSWAASILEHRQRLRDDFEDSPSLRRHAADVFDRAYNDARAQAGIKTALPKETFPARSCYTLDQPLDPDFMPD